MHCFIVKSNHLTPENKSRLFLCFLKCFFVCCVFTLFLTDENVEQRKQGKKCNNCPKAGTIIN